MGGAGMEPTKSFASLSPTLLARKGGARPAMRPVTQIACYGESLAHDINSDLGWDDFGPHADDAADHPETATIIQISRETAEPQAAPVVPAVVNQRKAAAKRIATVATCVAPKVRRSALEAGRKAAFTLRLDAERHFKLRLACAVDATSAQQLVTVALDRLLDEMPEIATLADQAAKHRKS